MVNRNSIGRALVRAAVILPFMAVCSCKTFTKKPPVQPAQVIDEQRPWLTSGARPRVALVLSGGSSRGFAHIGVIRQMEKEKIPIDFIVGTSAGSLIGALYGKTRNSQELESVGLELRKEDIFDFTLLTPTQGFVKGESFALYLKNKFGDTRLEQLRVPLYITATDLQTGELVLFSSGPVDTAVLASASIPGLFPPVLIGSRQYVDGGVVSNLPVETARQKGADIVIAVDLSKESPNRELKDVVDYVMQSVSIMMSMGSQVQVLGADIAIRPNLDHIGIWDFDHKKELISIGQQSTKDLLPRFRQVFNQWYASRTPDKSTARSKPPRRRI